MIRSQCKARLCMKQAAVLRSHAMLFVVPKGRVEKEIPDILIDCLTSMQWLAAGLLLLNRRTRAVAIGTEYAAIPFLSSEKLPAIRTLPKELAGIGWHGRIRLLPAFRAGDGGLELYLFIHFLSRFPVSFLPSRASRIGQSPIGPSSVQESIRSVNVS